jgi:hypothetical protein
MITAPWLRYGSETPPGHRQPSPRLAAHPRATDRAGGIRMEDHGRDAATG